MTRREYRKYFETTFRADGIECMCKTDDHPEDLDNLIYSIHEELDAMPNDWIYRIILEAFEAMEEEDYTWEDCTIESDVYNSDLYKWFGEPYAPGFIEQYVTELSDTKDIWTMISGGQWLAMERIYQMVSDFINEPVADEVEE